MKASVYYSVQFAQSEYLLLWEKGLYTQIVERTFADNDDISVSYEGYGSARGREAVIRFFEKLGDDAAKNGSIIRNDLPESQLITWKDPANASAAGRSDSSDCEASDPAANASAARGEWITMTGIIEGPAFGVAAPPYPYKYYIGKYDNTYVRLADGRWGIQSIDWKPVLAVGDWTMDPAKGIGLYYTQPEKWPTPFRRRSVEDDADPVTQTKVDVRLAIMRFAHDFLKNGVKSITEERFSEEAGRHAREMLDGTQATFKGAPMLTSPILSVSEDGTQAQVFLNTLYIKPMGEKEVHKVTSNKGRISARMVKKGDTWFFETFDWQCYCTLVPWKVTGYWPENI